MVEILIPSYDQINILNGRLLQYIQVSRKFHSFKLCKVVTVILEKYNREMKCKKKLEKMRVIETMYCQMPFGLLKDVLNTLLF